MADLEQRAEILDPKVIESLKELGGEDDPELFDELVDLFCEDSPQRIQKMVEALDAGDWMRVEGMAHALRSSSANLGAMRLSALCRDIEAQAKTGSHVEAAEMVRRAPSEYQRVADALRRA